MGDENHPPIQYLNLQKRTTGMNTKFFILSFTFLFNFLIPAIYTQSDFFTFQITLRPDNLYALSPKLAEQDFKELAALVSQHTHFFELLLTNPAHWSESIEREKSCNKVFAMLGMKNLGDGNYVIDIGKFLIKIAGHTARASNLLSEHGHKEYDAFCVSKTRAWSEVDSIINTQQLTYQTASRIANYLVAASMISEHNLARSIVVPSMYIATFDGSSNIQDDNVIIVEEKLSNLQPLSLYLKDKELPEQVVQDLVVFIARTGLCDLQDTVNDKEPKYNLFITQEGKIALVDLEQPCTRCPRNAFFGISTKYPRENYELDIVRALQQLREFFAGTSTLKYFQIIDDFVATDTTIQQFNCLKNCTWNCTNLDKESF